MDIDKILDQWGEEQINGVNMPQDVREKCWNSIKSEAGKRKKWYDRLFIELMHINKRYHMKLVVQIAMALVIIFFLPTLISTTKNYVQKSAGFNRNQEDKAQETKVDNKKDIDKNEDKSQNTKREENSEDTSDTIYQKAEEKVKEMAKAHYDKFTIYSTGEIIKSRNDNRRYYIFGVFQNLVGDGMPSPPDYIMVDVDSLDMKMYDGITDVKSYYESKPSPEPLRLSDDQICRLINKVENLGSENNYGDLEAAYGKSTVASNNKTYALPDGSFYCKDQKDVYYSFDMEKGKLYKWNIISKGQKLIYTVDRNRFSVMTTEKKEDIDEDGKIDDIKYDELRGVLGVNGTLINNGTGLSFDSLNIIDINKKDNQMEICVTVSYDTVGPNNSVYLYKDGLISEIGSSSGRAVTAGDGIIKYNDKLSQFFETHQYDAEFQYNNNNVLREEQKEIYAMKGTHDTLQVKRALKIYKDRNSTDLAATLEAGESVKVIGSDEKNWVLIENSKGTRGWLQVEDNTVKELNLRCNEVFDNLFIAG